MAIIRRSDNESGAAFNDYIIRKYFYYFIVVMMMIVLVVCVCVRATRHYGIIVIMELTVNVHWTHYAHILKIQLMRFASSASSECVMLW